MDVIQLINSVGFPIAACVYMAYYQNKTIDKLRETIDNNTKAMIKLAERASDNDIDVLD